MTPHKVLTVVEAAETLRCSERRVWGLIADGVLSKAPSYGKRTLVYAESVFEALERAYHPGPGRKRKPRKPQPEKINPKDVVI